VRPSSVCKVENDTAFAAVCRRGMAVGDFGAYPCEVMMARKGSPFGDSTFQTSAPNRRAAPRARTGDPRGQLDHREPVKDSHCPSLSSWIDSRSPRSAT